MPDWAKVLGVIVSALLKKVLGFAVAAVSEHEVQERWATRVKPFFASIFSRSREVVIYDSAKSCSRSDFQGKQGKRWSDTEHRSIGPEGEGILTVLEGGILSVERTNREGRFEIWLHRYNYKGSKTVYLPENPQMTGDRRLRVTCEAKVTDGRHTLWFLFKDRRTDKSPERPKEVVIDRNEWIPVDLTFVLSPAATYHLRIDDQDVSQVPSILQIRSFRVTEIAG